MKPFNEILVYLIVFDDLNHIFAGFSKILLRKSLEIERKQDKRGTFQTGRKG